jgi:hypothetical protein
MNGNKGLESSQPYHTGETWNGTNRFIFSRTTPGSRSQPISTARPQRCRRSGLRPVLLLLNTLGLMALVMLVGDALLFDWRPGFIPALLGDDIAHPWRTGCAGLAPLFFWRDPNQESGFIWPAVLTWPRLEWQRCSSTWTISRNAIVLLLFDATHLNGRPATHSLLFAAVRPAGLGPHPPVTGRLGNLRRPSPTSCATPEQAAPHCSGRMKDTSFFPSPPISPQLGLCLLLAALYTAHSSSKTHS